MIQRVEDRKPIYRTKVWLEERKQNLTYLWNISRFPEVYPKTHEKPAKNGTSVIEKSRPKSAHPSASAHGEVHTTRSVQLRIEFLKRKELLNSRKAQELQPKRQISSAV